MFWRIPNEVHLLDCLRQFSIPVLFVWFLLLLPCATAHNGTPRSWRGKVGVLFHNEAEPDPVRTV
jgi:hypothetical protein